MGCCRASSPYLKTIGGVSFTFTTKGVFYYALFITTKDNMLRSIFVFITISLMTFLLQYWFVSRLGYPETFATTCQDYTGEFLSEARCEYTFNILFTTITVAFFSIVSFYYFSEIILLYYRLFVAWAFMVIGFSFYYL